jgi:hypothetical protein
MSFSFGSKEQKQTQQSESNPWGPTIGPLNDFISKLAGQSKGLGQLNGAETEQFDKLKASADQGNPWSSAISGLADKFFGTTSRSGDVTAAYAGMKDQLTPYAEGKHLDLEGNPYVKDMLAKISSDVSNSVNSQFAGMGRDLSGMHVKALSRGIAEGEAPVMAGLYQDAQAKQIDAAKTLGTAGMTSAQTAQGLDKDALAVNALGMDVGDKALDAKNYSANTRLQLEEQLKKLPVDQLGWIAQYLFPAAQLGGTQTGESQGTQKGFNIGMKLYGN